MLEVYLITRLTALNGFFFAVATITGIITVICAIVYGVNYMDDYYGDRDKLQVALKKWIRNCTYLCSIYSI